MNNIHDLYPFLKDADFVSLVQQLWHAKQQNPNEYQAADQVVIHRANKQDGREKVVDFMQVRKKSIFLKRVR